MPGFWGFLASLDLGGCGTSGVAGLLQVWIGGFPACLDLGFLARLDLGGLCKSGVDTGTVTIRQKPHAGIMRK